MGSKIWPELEQMDEAHWQNKYRGKCRKYALTSMKNEKKARQQQYSAPKMQKNKWNVAILRLTSYEYNV